jgi:hypothetical protein
MKQLRIILLQEFLLMILLPVHVNRRAFSSYFFMAQVKWQHRRLDEAVLLLPWTNKAPKGKPGGTIQ